MNERRAVFTDANILINFTLAGRLDILRGLDLDLRIPEEVVREITRPGQRLQLDKAFDAGWLRMEILNDAEALALYTQLRSGLDSGESACLALAAGCGGLVACDEKGLFLRQASRYLGEGRVLNTSGLLLRAIRRGLLTVSDADGIKLFLESHRFRMPFASFQNLL